MSNIHFSKEAFEKLRNSPQDKKTAMLLSKFNPGRSEKSKYKDYKTEIKAKRIREIRKDGTFKKDDKDRELYEDGQISLEEYNERKFNKTAQSLAAQFQKIRIKNGLEKPKKHKIKHVHTESLGYSNRSVFRANDKDLWPYKK